ncbi:MAG: hypothetical protein HGB12_00090 [Bacteroidetes bacterium]|nr:hypothetical protein [Bacteroidota bacterium]
MKKKINYTYNIYKTMKKQLIIQHIKLKYSMVYFVILFIIMNSCNQIPPVDKVFKIIDTKDIKFSYNSKNIIQNEGLHDADNDLEINDPQELRLSYNSKTTILDSNKRQIEFHGKWINYMNENNTWKEINPDFVKTAKGFEMKEAPFQVLAPFYADEPAVFNNNNRYDVFTNEIIYDKPLEQTIQALGTAHVAGKTETGNLGWGKAQYVVYPNAYPDIQADLIYWVHQGKAPRLRKFIRFNQILAKNTDFQFKVIYSDEVETVNDGKNVTVKLKNAESKRGNGWANFYIWDSKGGWAKREPIRFDFEKPMLASATNVPTDPNEFILTKHIEAAYFKTATLPVFTDATSTFYPDPDVEVNTVDGSIQYNTGSGTWASGYRSAVSGHYAYPSVINTDFIGTRDNTFYLQRGVFLFNTSTLTSNASISSATFALSVLNSSGQNVSYSFGGCNPASNTDLSTADYSCYTALNSQTEFAPRSSNITGTTTFTLNSSGLAAISKTGITKFMAREGCDFDNTTPINNNVTHSLSCYFAEQTGTSQDPQLVIVYTIINVAPTVTTQAVTSVTGTTSTGNGNVTADGGATITERGVCWNTSATPTTANNKATSAGTTGAFTPSITGLTAGTLYYVRAYAINSVGTSYGNEVSFTTLNVPTVTTQAGTSITSTTATGNGNVTADGGTTITERGVCWNTSTTPTTANSKGITAGTTGAFASSMTGLTAGTLYYVRAYAINSVGISYGNQVTFSTPAPATVNWNNSNVQEITLTANRSLTFINGKSGGLYTLIIKQNSTGGWTVSWPSNVKWDGGIAPVFNTAPYGVGSVKFVYDGTNFLDDGVRLDIK